MLLQHRLRHNTSSSRCSSKCSSSSSGQQCTLHLDQELLLVLVGCLAVCLDPLLLVPSAGCSGQPACTRQQQQQGLLRLQQLEVLQLLLA
jgi:hypothetical protein